MSKVCRCQTGVVFSGPVGCSGVDPVCRSRNLWSSSSHTADVSESCISVELLSKTEWEMSGAGERGVMHEAAKLAQEKVESSAAVKGVAGQSPSDLLRDRCEHRCAQM